MKANKYFDVKELVPKEVWEELGDEGSLKLLNPAALKALEEVREIIGIPLICNNWASGGSRNYCGYRQQNCPIGAKGSQHKKGNAFDLISNSKSARLMRYELEQNKMKLSIPIRIEKWDQKGVETTWLHIDTKNFTGNEKIYFFKA